MTPPLNAVLRGHDHLTHFCQIRFTVISTPEVARYENMQTECAAAMEASKQTGSNEIDLT